MPFAQYYIEESRYTRAKQDLDEIKSSLIRYESDQSRPYTQTTLDGLIGAYLSRGLSDPWGNAYLIAPASSTCYSLGADRMPGTGDEIEVFFRPPLAISKIYWEDSNKNLLVDDNDRLIFRFTRPVRRNVGDGPQLSILSSDFIFSGGAPAGDFSALEFTDFDMTVKLALDFAGAVPFKVGNDTISVTNTNTIVDGVGVRCKTGQSVLIKSR
ncbi:MAG: type II secretion system protein GspG [Candidatus Rifleibacteriota bacterium]